MKATEHREPLEREPVPTDPAGRHSRRTALLLCDVLEQLESVDTRPDRSGILRRFWRWLF